MEQKSHLFEVLLHFLFKKHVSVLINFEITTFSFVSKYENKLKIIHFKSHKLIISKDIKSNFIYSLADCPLKSLEILKR